MIFGCEPVNFFRFSPGTRLPPHTEPPTTPLLRRCQLVQSERVLAADPTLHARLVDLGVEPQLYLLRWLRLLFRELPPTYSTAEDFHLSHMLRK